MTSVKELLLDLTEELIEWKVPHYFMPANNIENDFRVAPTLIMKSFYYSCCREEESLEIVGNEPKAPFFLITCTSNESLHSLGTLLSIFSRSLITGEEHTQCTLRLW